MKKKILSLALALALSAGLAAPALAVYETPTFTDVPKSHWAYTYVEQAAKEGWVSGTGNGKFQPDGMVTYAQFCVMLTNAFTFFQDRLAQYTGPSSPWYAPYCGTIGEMGYFNQTAVKGKHTDDAVMNSPINRYDMAGMLYPIFERAAHISVSLDYEAVQASTPDYEASPIRYKTPIALVKTYGIISGIDSAGNFGGSGNMTRAQAAVVLCKMHEAVQKNIPAWYTEQQETPVYSTEPEKPVDSTPVVYGPVGTMSDSPVTLSLETHKPIHDYWSQQSAEIRSLTDKDAFNAAVQTMKDAELILTEGEIINSGVYRNRGINPYYNYAMADLSTDKAKAVTQTVGNIRGYAYGNYAYMMGATVQGFFKLGKATDSDQLAEVFAPIFARFPANATDRQKVDICMQEIVDRFDYKTGTSGFTWLNGNTEGNCESYARATSQILAAAGIPNMVITASIDGVGHALVQAYIDGQWMDVDGTLSESSGVGAKGVKTFEEYERSPSVQHVSNNTDETKVARALVEASLS